MFKEESEDNGSNEDREPNDDDGSLKDKAQVIITAGNAAYHDNLFPSNKIF